MWNVRTTMEWSDPVSREDFENDVTGGPIPGVAIGGLIFVLATLFIAWTPQDVWIPAIVPVIIVLLLLYFPLRWLVRRPWSVIAETPGDTEEHPPERWVGIMRGGWNSRQLAGRVARDLEVYGEPRQEKLQQVDEAAV